MTMPFYSSVDQLLRDRSELARKGIARGRSVVVLTYTGGVLFVAENRSSTLHKVSEVYDRIGFAAVGRYNEFETLRNAGIRMADVRGYSYDRRDVTGRMLANFYAQVLGSTFVEQQKPYEVELCLAGVGATADDDELYRITYDGSITDEPPVRRHGWHHRSDQREAQGHLRGRSRPGAAIGLAVEALQATAPERRVRPRVATARRVPRVLGVSRARGRGAGPGAAPAHVPPDHRRRAARAAPGAEPHASTRRCWPESAAATTPLQAVGPPRSRTTPGPAAAAHTAAAVPVVVDRPVRVSPRAPAAAPAARGRSSPGTRPCSACSPTICAQACSRRGPSSSSGRTRWRCPPTSTTRVVRVGHRGCGTSRGSARRRRTTRPPAMRPRRRARNPPG